MNIKNLIGFATGPIAAAALGLIITPVVSWVFSPEDVGRLNIFQTTVSFCLLLTALGLDQAYVREYHSATDRESLFKACFMPGLFILALLFAPTLMVTEKITNFLYETSDTRLYAITMMAVVITYLSRFLSLILRMQERGVAFSISQVLPKILQLTIIVGLAALPFHKEFIHLLLASFVSFTLVFLIYAWNTRYQWLAACTKKIDITQLFKLLRFGFPLIFAGLAFWSINAISVFSLRTLSNLSELAIYSVAFSFAGAATIVQAIFSLIWTPMAFKWEAQKIDMQRIDSVSQMLLAIISAVAVACGSLAWVVDILLPETYSQVKYLLLCCMIQPLLYTLSTVTSIGIGLARRNIFSLLSASAALITNISLSLSLIPQYGAKGAVISNALAFLVLFIVNTEASAWVWRQFPRRKIYIFVGLIVGLSVLTTALGSIAPFHFSMAWLSLAPLIYLVFKRQWIEIFTLAETRVNKFRSA